MRNTCYTALCVLCVYFAFRKLFSNGQEDIILYWFRESGASHVSHYTLLKRKKKNRRKNSGKRPLKMCCSPVELFMTTSYNAIYLYARIFGPVGGGRTTSGIRGREEKNDLRAIPYARAYISASGVRQQPSLSLMAHCQNAVKTSTTTTTCDRFNNANT